MGSAAALKRAADALPRGEARRDVIVDAALAVIADVGPDALTHRRVAADAGVPLAATTYWFSSKAELVRAAFRRAVDSDLERLTARARVAVNWTRENVATELARTLHTTLEEDRTTVLVDASLWTEALRRPELRAEAERWTDAYVDFYRELLRRIDSSVSEVDIRLISAAIDGLVTRELSYERPRAERLLRHDLERLLGAFLDSGGP